MSKFNVTKDHSHNENSRDKYHGHNEVGSRRIVDDAVSNETSPTVQFPEEENNSEYDHLGLVVPTETLDANAASSSEDDFARRTLERTKSRIHLPLEQTTDENYNLNIKEAKAHSLDSTSMDSSSELNYSSSDFRKYGVEPTLSTLEREILLRGEASDNKKSKFPQPPSDNSPRNSEKEAVGDDIAKTTAHILCECEIPGVAGAAVPIVTSFVENVSQDRATPVEPTLRTGSARNGKLEELNRTLKDSGVVTPQALKGDEEPKATKNICFGPDPTQTKPPLSNIPTDNYDEEKEELKNEKRCKRLTNEFSRQVSRLAQEASNLSESNTVDQLKAADNLCKQIVSLRRIVSELKAIRASNHSEMVMSETAQNLEETQLSSDSNSKSKGKDNNRIHIKFLPSKLAVRRRRSCNSEAQTDDAADVSLKEVDSVDGMFIPSFDEPPAMEEDEDDDGLDITIRFPELQRTLDEEVNSNLSVCFSDISAEALGRLKRCPKEFTLRMDFVQGKMFFQSGKCPANNFAIGPDLKITECFIDSRQSDIINIKPSTECLYTSQIIPVVGGTTPKESVKILRSTDSELFNVVSLPFITKRQKSSTKSCTTFKNMRRASSECCISVKTHYKSMPQIPSLTRILEEPAMETYVSFRTAMNGEKRPRNRSLQKKKPNSRVHNVLSDTT